MVESLPRAKECTCLAVRQAARHITQFYDQYLAPAGLRTTQYSILTRLKLKGPMTINAMAEEMVMDRTTLGRNVLPLERDGLIAIRKSPRDGRSKEIHLTDAGLERLKLAYRGWQQAQAQFDAAFGGERASDLRAILQAVTATDLSEASSVSTLSGTP